MPASVLRKVPPVVYAVTGPIFLLPFVIWRQWKSAAILAGTSAFAWLGFMGLPAVGPGGSGPKGEVRVVSYNVMFSGRGEDGIEVALRRLAPDILAAQECRTYRPKNNSRRAIDRALPDFHVVQNVDMILASRFPLTNVRTEPLIGNREGRLALIAEAVTPQGRLTLINVHLVPEYLEDYKGLGAKLERMRESDVHRYRQVQRLLEIVQDVEGPVILLGDFNLSPNAQGYGQLRQSLTDSFSVAGRGYGHTLTSDIPVKRIDYMWNRGLTTTRAYVPNVRDSDHRPLVCEFNFKR